MADFDSTEKDAPDGAGPAQAGGAGGGSDHGRKAITALAAVVAMAGFAALVFYFYDGGTAPGTGEDAPLITAAKGPTKVRPKEPGGMEVPDRDMQVFSRINPNENPPRIEQLLPPPETVVALPPPETVVAPPPVAEAGPTVELDEKIRRALATAPAAGPAPVEDLMAPPPPPATPLPVAKPAAAKAKTETGAAKTEPASVPRPPATATVPPPAPKVVASRGDKGVWRVQIGASRSIEAARKSWRAIKRKHGDVFGKLQLMLRKADLGKSKGIYYRMQVGPLADADGARKLCARVKRRKIECFVVKP